MGDRFYMQQLAALGDCPGNRAGVARKARKVGAPKKLTKAAILEDLPLKTAGLSKLKVDALLELAALDYSKSFNIDMPTGRLKAPYLEALSPLGVDLSAMTVADLTSLIKELNK